VKFKLLIIANNNIGPGQSGGDTIFLEFIKNWQKQLDITVFGSQETLNLLHRYHLKTNFILTDKINLHCQPTIKNLIFHTFRRLYRGSLSYFSHLSVFKQADYCYTASDFIPDHFFGWLYKIINESGVWLSGHYLFVPRFGSKYNPYRQQPLKGWFYYQIQNFTRFISQHFADQIFITSQPDSSRFPHKKVIVIQGGVELAKSGKMKPIARRRFDAVFQGRLHPQKGVLELIDIWSLVVKKNPIAKLAIIGDGQLENKLKSKIKKLKLTKNITLFGFQNGKLKYDIFKNSKIVVHPAIYDSGGMAAAEAMAWGLPGVSFDLESLKTYYPQGMIKTPLGDNQQFADNIITLLTNQKLYQKTSHDALKLIKDKWNWHQRSQEIFKKVFI
jgi:glycosyltransferase involved in cell wall biosynthesis